MCLWHQGDKVTSASDIHCTILHDGNSSTIVYQLAPADSAMRITGLIDRHQPHTVSHVSQYSPDLQCSSNSTSKISQVSLLQEMFRNKQRSNPMRKP